MTRSEVRHALYRAKNGIMVDGKQHIYDLVAPNLPPNETWEGFSVSWDVFVDNGVVTVIIPEVDYDFIHSTCIEKALHAKNNLTMQPTDRQANALQIVELNMLDKKMTWDTYNVTWGVTVDRELKRIYTRLFRTVVNSVTDEMIQNSAPSDGSAMVEIPSVPSVSFTETEIISKEEFESLTSQTAPSSAKRSKTK